MWIDSSRIHGDSLLKVLVNLFVTKDENLTWKLDTPKKKEIFKKLQLFKMLFAPEGKNTFNELVPLFRSSITNNQKPFEMKIGEKIYKLSFSFDLMVNDMKAHSLCSAKGTAYSKTPCPWCTCGLQKYTNFVYAVTSPLNNPSIDSKIKKFCAKFKFLVFDDLNSETILQNFLFQ